MIRQIEKRNARNEGGKGREILTAWSFDMRTPTHHPATVAPRATGEQP